VPTVYGESVSLRLLTRGKIFLSLDKLGFSQMEETAIRDIIIKPHGIFLVTGPTGSGKSTSLYAFLSAINSIHKRIITIEEPVEYELKGINQIAVRSDIGLTFAMGLRHILRQDPNVVMVGEIRDTETAEIAIRASLTGHLVFSTLHTNDAPSAFTRLIDMGIEPFLVASSVEAVMAQRLIRTICPHCKTEQIVDREYLHKVGFPRRTSRRRKSGTAWAARNAASLAIRAAKEFYELLLVNEALRPLIMNRAPATTIAARAIENGMRTLRVDGWNKVKAGVTTIEEVLRVTQIEEHVGALIESESLRLSPANESRSSSFAKLVEVAVSVIGRGFDSWIAWSDRSCCHCLGQGLSAFSGPQGHSIPDSRWTAVFAALAGRLVGQLVLLTFGSGWFGGQG